MANLILTPFLRNQGSTICYLIKPLCLVEKNQELICFFFFLTMGLWYSKWKEMKSDVWYSIGFCLNLCFVCKDKENLCSGCKLRWYIHHQKCHNVVCYFVSDTKNITMQGMHLHCFLTLHSVILILFKWEVILKTFKDKKLQ